MSEDKKVLAIEAASAAVKVLKGGGSGTVSGELMILCLAAMLVTMHDGAMERFGRDDADRMLHLVGNASIDTAWDTIEAMVTETVKS